MMMVCIKFSSAYFYIKLHIVCTSKKMRVGDDGVPAFGLYVPSDLESVAEIESETCYAEPTTKTRIV